MARPPLSVVTAQTRQREIPPQLVLALNEAAIRAIAIGATAFIIGMQSGDEEMTVMSYPPAKAVRTGLANEVLNQVTPREWVDPDDV